METINEHTISDDPNVIAFHAKAFELVQLYERKNHDYGDSFGKTFRQLGQLGIITAWTRMSDKWNRFTNLVKQTERKVDDETIEDTLKDIASYAIMTLNELDKLKDNENQD